MEGMSNTCILLSLCIHVADTPFQKSKEKNLVLEDTKRRNEASMKRKQINANLANGLPPSSSSPSSDATPLSPTTTGAMDDLLTKLRAAAPQARDQRDRRRRARLKDRHQVRVASGQKMPDLAGPGSAATATAGHESDDGSAGAGGGLMSPQSFGTESEEGSEQRPGTAGGDSNAGGGDGAADEGGDIADRAASMLQGLRGGEGEGGVGAGESGGAGGGGREDSLRMRRRRESADEERARRRNRRHRAGQQSSGDVTATATSTSTPILEEEKEEDGESEQGQQHSTTPVTVVSPPSPEPGAKTTQTATPPPD